MIETYTVGSSLFELLINRPETGMGYQYFKFDDSKKETTPVIQKEQMIISNCETIIFSAREFPILTSWSKADMDRSEIDQEDTLEFTKAFNGISKEYTFIQKFERFKNDFKISVKGDEQLKPPYTYLTRQGDEFRRLSAFRNDNRVVKDGSLRNGSFGTTILDLESATSGVAAVGRYALPNRLAACYVYQIIPPPGTKVLFGTVTPNFGLCGGGVEVYFPEGCAEGSVRLIGTIPEF